jgi:hypothetical protein
MRDGYGRLPSEMSERTASSLPDSEPVYNRDWSTVVTAESLSTVSTRNILTNEWPRNWAISATSRSAFKSHSLHSDDHTHTAIPQPLPSDLLRPSRHRRGQEALDDLGMRARRHDRLDLREEVGREKSVRLVQHKQAGSVPE